jgi:hypothetical protein
MLNNHMEIQIRECCQQAAQCVQQAEAQNDPKVQKQFLELARRWILLARALTDPTVTSLTVTQAERERFRAITQRTL